MLWELAVSELRYRAVLEVLDGATVTSVARRFGVSRGTVHVWLGRYAGTGGVVNLQDRSSRPHSCPHQMSPAVEARVLAIRDGHPGWGPDRIVYELERGGVSPVPSRSAVYRALVRDGKVFTGRFGPRGSVAEVMFDRICAENGIRHLLTAPRSPTTTGKVEWLHKTMRAEFFNDADRRYHTIQDLQQSLDEWVAVYNTERRGREPRRSTQQTRMRSGAPTAAARPVRRASPGRTRSYALPLLHAYGQRTETGCRRRPSQSGSPVGR